MDAVVPLLIGYGIGSLPVGYLVASRLKGVDLRRVGSGNVGAANAYRTAGLVLALLVICVDVAKGATSVLFASRLGHGTVEPVAAGVAAIIGHIYPVWLRFHGGKGVATACGAFWMLAPLATALSGLLFVATVWISRYVSLGSVIATAALPPLAWITARPIEVLAGATVAATVVIVRHRSNLARLHTGTEMRLQAPSSARGDRS